MQDPANKKSVIDACAVDGRKTLLADMKKGLNLCERSLKQYLETKRLKFPRFYFISNSALLDILSNGHDPQAIQKHLGDCFDNIKSLKFVIDENATKQAIQHAKDNNEEINEKLLTKYTNIASHMYSKDGDECVPIKDQFHCKGAAEDWLNDLVKKMKETLRFIMSKAKFSVEQWDLENPRTKWLYNYPAQVALTASQIIWTEEVESQFKAVADGNEQAMKEYAKLLHDRLNDLIGLVLDLNMTHEDRVKVITLITVDVHNRDVVNYLIEDKTQKVLNHLPGKSK